MRRAHFDRRHHPSIIVFRLQRRPRDADDAADSLAMVSVALCASLRENLLASLRSITLILPQARRSAEK